MADCLEGLALAGARALESEEVTGLTKPIDLGTLHRLLARLAAGSAA